MPLRRTPRLPGRRGQPAGRRRPGGGAWPRRVVACRAWSRRRPSGPAAPCPRPGGQRPGHRAPRVPGRPLDRQVRPVRRPAPAVRPARPAPQVRPAHRRPCPARWYRAARCRPVLREPRQARRHPPPQHQGLQHQALLRQARRARARPACPRPAVPGLWCPARCPAGLRRCPRRRCPVPPVPPGHRRCRARGGARRSDRRGHRRHRGAARSARGQVFGVRAPVTAAVQGRGRAGRRLVVDHGPGLGGGQVGSGVAHREGRVPRLRLGLGGTARPAGDTKPCGTHGGAVPQGELARRVDRVRLAGPRRVTADGAAPAALPG